MRKKKPRGTKPSIVVVYNEQESLLSELVNNNYVNKYRVSYSLAYARFKSGWSASKIFNTPVNHRLKTFYIKGTSND